MKKLFCSILLLCTAILTFAQHADTNYKPTKEKIHALQHTKLKVAFDFAKKQLHGEAWLTLKPHFYTANKVVLDAKEMLIYKVEMQGKALEYNYSDNEITVYLPKQYTKEETYEIYIQYTAQPNKVTNKKEKGLFFIATEDKNPEIPTQIWTQGETSYNSVWFPTIDSPNQKTSQEIYITVPKKYTTLSNGTLVNSTENEDNTRTDYWKQDQKHAPYLVFLAVGEFKIVKDSWKGKEVSYYVEEGYEPYARDIFGMTPKMLDFFLH